MQQPGTKYEMGGTDFKWGAGTTVPPLATALCTRNKTWTFVASTNFVPIVYENF